MKFNRKSKLAILTMVAGGILLGSSTTVNAALTPSSTLPKTDMVDVSSWQGNLTAADYQTMASNGVKAVTIKATEGTNYTNPYLSQQVQYAQQAGLSINFITSFILLLPSRLKVKLRILLTLSNWLPAPKMSLWWPTLNHRN